MRISLFHNKGFIAALCIAFMLFFTDCQRKRRTAVTFQSNWTSDNPLSVPYKLRLQKKEIGNLVTNDGFEQGKYFYFDTLPEGTFDIQGWKRVGENVEWVDIENRNVFDTSEVASGGHAVKIHRNIANETEDTGEGIVSDFLKVIPGNYQLSLDVKLKDVNSHKARLGTKIYNSIDIRIIYYDKNKIEINSQVYSPHYQTNVNTSFKGYPFSNFWSIDSLDWTRVFCSSANYPFPEGNIPNDARFVKIFLGFKGEGTMWVDNVSYNYTDYNFTVAELIEPYFAKKPNDLHLLLPAPQQLEKIKTLEINDSTRVLIVAASRYMQLADSLAKHLEQQCKAIVAKSKNREKEEGFDLVISLGKTGLTEDYENRLKDKPSGSYFIQAIENEHPVIQVGSNGPEGMHYAYLRLLQLIPTAQNKIHLVNLHDWPWFRQRGFILPEKSSGLDSMKGYFTNGWIAPDLSDENVETSSFVHPGKIISRKKPRNGRFEMDKFIMFSQKPVSAEEYNPYLPVNSAKIFRNDSILHAENLISFNNWNNTEMLDMFYDKFDSYYRSNELFYSGSLAFSWTGPSEISYYIDNTSYLRYKNYVKRPVWFVDQTLEQNHPLFTGFTSTFFVPVYRTKFTDDILIQLDKSIWFELKNNSPFSVISALTAVDFAWNPLDYNPWLSLYKVLVNQYGINTARQLIQFNDIYIKAQNLIASTARDQMNNRTIRGLDESLTALKIILNNLELSREEWDYLNMLHKELSDKRDIVISRADITDEK